MNRNIVIVIGLVFFASASFGQQVPDTAFAPPIPDPLYKVGKGPLVLIDEAHFNFHTVDGRYQPFAALLRRDGYDVRGSKEIFSADSLKAAKILVVANALSKKNETEWTLPTPAAFTSAEVKAVRDWVKQGGSLLLIVDHMPFPGAAENLAKAFGVTFSNGYAMDPDVRAPMVFRLADGSLKSHPILNGRTEAEKVDSVASFTGSAFRAGRDAQPLMVLRSSVVSVLTTTAGQIKEEAPRAAPGACRCQIFTGYLTISPGWPISATLVTSQKATLHKKAGRP